MAYQNYWDDKVQSVQHNGSELSARTSLYVDQHSGRSVFTVDADPNNERRTNEATPTLARDAADAAQLDYNKMDVYQRTGSMTYLQRDADSLGQRAERENLSDPGRERHQSVSHEELNNRLDGALDKADESSRLGERNKENDQRTIDEERRRQQQQNKH